MKLSAKDKAFRTNKVSYMDFKLIEMDRVLTNLFARLKHSGAGSRLKAKPMAVEMYVEEFTDPKNQQQFQHFAQHQDTVKRWVETHLVDMVNRGKANEVVASPRPLHGNTYLFRNPKHCRDYGVSQQIYELLYYADKGHSAIEQLKQFFFAGVDANTGKYDGQIEVDVETQALLRLSDQVSSDAAETGDLQDRVEPLCLAAANILADDIIRLLVYKHYIPRTVMVDYIKTLLAFHLALYQLRIIKLLPALVKSKGHQAGDEAKCRIGLFVDVTQGQNAMTGQLAEASARLHFRRLPEFIKSYFAVKKLEEFAEYLSKKGRLSGSLSVKKMPVTALLRLLESPLQQERQLFFGQRNSALLDGSVSAAKDQESIPPEIQALASLGLDEFSTYNEILLYVQGNTIRSGAVKNLDSLMLKNKPGALLTQPQGTQAPRRFVLDSRLLEVLLQLAVLQPGGVQGFHTTQLRIDELLDWLQARYGLHIDRLPEDDDIADETINTRKVLRDNTLGFKKRLREIGFYHDLSDAYITQTVSPRYVIEEAVGA
ncbi:methylation-associated defense system protein MAD7 [Thiothrix lacustris]|uniref:methylation-associated defense system protein MAD7 n=1 Tax=Thiothrix lacustris TaxID=525917 RepID=UPI0027E457C4|nr:hypothetical protein [Thiothrix lacustris]WMP19481.1 hypothetical protein RCS87_19520 [Thiothrix lacustris]